MTVGLASTSSSSTASACGAQKYGRESFGDAKSRRRDAPASMDVGAKGLGVLCIEAGRS